MGRTFDEVLGSLLPESERAQQKSKLSALTEIPNLDAMPAAELLSFWGVWHRASSAQAAKLTGGRRGSRAVVHALANYASNKSTAMACRETGDIDTAIQYEKIADRIYDGLPDWAKW